MIISGILTDYFLIIKALSAQRRFTRAIPSLRHQPYLTRLNILELKTIEHRRLLLDLCFLFKLLNGFVKSDLLTFVQFSNYNRTLGTSFQIARGSA